MIDTIRVGATLATIQTKVDRSVKLTFISDLEMPDEKMTELMGMRGMAGWFTFSPSEPTEVFVPDEPPPEFKNQKTLSQRLYNVLFVLWKQKGEKGTSEEHRKIHMEQFIQWVKDKLEPEG